jgi:hypothetical protein
LRIFFPIFTCLVGALIVILAGGSPSLFRLLFVLGAVQSGLFIGGLGVALKADAALSQAKAKGRDRSVVSEAMEH